MTDNYNQNSEYYYNSNQYSNQGEMQTENDVEVAELKCPRLRGFISLVFYFLNNFVVASLVAGVIYFVMVDENPNLTQDEFISAVNSNGAYLMFGVLMLTLIQLIIVNFGNFKIKLSRDFKNVFTYIYPFIFIIVYFVLVTVMSLIIYAINPALQESENNQALIEMFNGGNKAIFVICVVILAPIVEELVFRYSLVELFNVRLKFLKWVPYVVSAFVFALIHEYTIFTNFSIDAVLLFTTYFVPALLLSIGYMVTKRNIVSMIILHMLINIIATLSIAFMV